jgi:peroxiredoxin
MKRNVKTVALIVGTMIAWTCGNRKSIRVDLVPNPEGPAPFQTTALCRIPLLPQPPETLVRTPPFFGRPLFGSMVFGNGSDSLITVVVDEPSPTLRRIWIDRNNNEDLSDDGDGFWKDVRSEVWTTWETVAVLVRTPEGEVSHPFGIALTRSQDRDHPALMVRRTGYNSGQILWDGKTYGLAVADGDMNGVYETDAVVMAVDRNRDGICNGSPESAERVEPGEPFRLNGDGFRLSEISPDGRWLNLEKVDSAVPAKPYIEPGYPAPAFSGTDHDGRPIDGASGRGHVVVLDFWASWSGPYLHELPALLAMHDRLSGQGLIVIGIPLDDDQTVCESFVRKHGIPWKQCVNPGGWKNRTVLDFRVRSIPRFFVLDRQGVIRFVSVTSADLADRVEELIAESPAEVL